MMKSILILCGIVAVSVAYDAKFDLFDAETAIKDSALLQVVMECFANLGDCTELASAYKALMPEIVATTCAKCTPRQMEIFKVVMRAAKNEYPELYAAFKKTYDPQNIKNAELDAFIS